MSEPEGAREFVAAPVHVRRRTRIVAVAGLLVAVTALPGGARQASSMGPRPTTRSSGAKLVSLGGITFALPKGWRVARPVCGQPDDHTVTIGFTSASCPGTLPQPPTTAVVLDTLYGPQLGPAWAGQRVLWQGQPAWLSLETTRSRATATLTLPWLNAVVIAQSGDQATARAVLDRIAARPGVGLEVPQAAVSVFIQSFTGHDGDHQRRNATVTKQGDVQRLLADLRSLPTTTSAQAACDGTWDPAAATLTVRGPRGNARMQHGSAGATR